VFPDWRRRDQKLEVSGYEDVYLKMQRWTCIPKGNCLAFGGLLSSNRRNKSEHGYFLNHVLMSNGRFLSDLLKIKHMPAKNREKNGPRNTES